MFMGKWRFHLPTGDVLPGCPTDGWASYVPSPQGMQRPGWNIWYTYNYLQPSGDKVGPFPPGKETNVAILARADGQLCFLLNDGSYVGYTIPECPPVKTLDEAATFSFPGHDLNTTPFDSHIQTTQDGWTLRDFTSELCSLGDLPHATMFTISQVTPPVYKLADNAKCDGFDFAWIDLSNWALSNASFVKADFSNCNLSQATFIGCDFTEAVLTNANLNGTQFLGCKMDRAYLNNCNLTGGSFTNSTLFGTHLEGAILDGANLMKTRLAGAVFKQADLTNVVVFPGYMPQFYNVPLAPPSPANPRTTLAGCRLNQSLIGNDWSMLDLTGSTILGLSSPLSSSTNPLKANYAVLTGVNKNSFIGQSLQSAVFDNAVLDGLALNSSGSRITDLSNASFVQASMHGTNLSGAILKGAKMMGAQLGGLGQLFTLPTSFIDALNDGPGIDPFLRAQFTQQGINLSTTATVSIQAPNRVWLLDDLGNNTTYTIRLEQTDATQILTVYLPTTSASLVDAYMPDAVLSGANLYGVLASRAHFYGAAARIDSFAILESVEFNEANLSNLNLTQAHLYGANLSGAQLFNAKFNLAKLGPAANGVATNLSGANLQGADFTDAQLYAANLENAAIAIKIATKANPNQGGAYLFSLPYRRDSHTIDKYIAELNAAAATLFSLNPQGDDATLQKYVTALKTNNISVLKVPFIQHKITLSAAAQIQTIDPDQVWQIVDGPQSYSLWKDQDEEGNTELYAASSLTISQAAFQQNNMILRWQASAAVDIAGKQWLLDNDSENPQNFSTGYVRFIVTLNDTALDVYGTAVRVERLGDQQQLQLDTENCNITTLAATNMNGQTVCPNGTTLSVNQQGEETWEQWLRAALPPKPPTCVPTDFNWCPPSSMATEEEAGSTPAREEH